MRTTTWTMPAQVEAKMVLRRMAREAILRLTPRKERKMERRNEKFETKRGLYEAKFDTKKAFGLDYTSIPNDVNAQGLYEFLKQDATYTVTVKDGNCTCNCKGFEFNGYCKHTTHVRALRGDIRNKETEQPKLF